MSKLQGSENSSLTESKNLVESSEDREVVGCKWNMVWEHGKGGTVQNNTLEHQMNEVAASLKPEEDINVEQQKDLWRMEMNTAS